MIRAVLDSSVLIKGIFKPLRSLSKDAYSRELETHEKCKYLIKLIEMNDVEVHVPRICIVETAAVIKRLASRTLAARASEGIIKSYNIADEELIFNIAWNVALDTGCSGFDSYFIALTREKDALLFTDDSGMHYHAQEVGVNSILMRSTAMEALAKKIKMASRRKTSSIKIAGLFSLLDLFWQIEQKKSARALPVDLQVRDALPPILRRIIRIPLPLNPHL